MPVRARTLGAATLPKEQLLLFPFFFLAVLRTTCSIKYYGRHTQRASSGLRTGVPETLDLKVDTDKDEAISPCRLLNEAL